MITYAVLDGDTVINIIVADSQDIAEQVTGKECIVYTEENPAVINGTYNRKQKVFVPADVETPTE